MESILSSYNFLSLIAFLLIVVSTKLHFCFTVKQAFSAKSIPCKRNAAIQGLIEKNNVLHKIIFYSLRPPAYCAIFSFEFFEHIDMNFEMKWQKLLLWIRQTNL
jgi:hypothetical protein